MADPFNHMPNKRALDEMIFKTTYMANFLATYMAINYDNDCMDGHERNRHDNQPVDDASYCANLAWEQIQEKL